MKLEMLMFMTYVEKKNSHGRTAVLTKLRELGLEKSGFYTMVEKSGKTSIGKNQLKFLLLDSFIKKLPDRR